jgi:hypothetical protein
LKPSFLQIVNCLEEWRTGTHIKIPFTGDRYDSVYQDMMSLICAVEEDNYHGQKLRKLLASIASDGRYVNINISIHFLLYFLFLIIGNKHHVIEVILGMGGLK